MIKAQKGILNCTLIINKTFRVWFLKAYYHFYADHIQLPCSFCEPEECKLSGWLNCWATWLSPVVIRVWIPVSSRPSATLGLLFDESMHHWRNLVKKCFVHLRNISQLKNTVSLSDLEMYALSSLSSSLDCCFSLIVILSALHWLPVKFCIDFKILVSTFRAIDGKAL